MAALEAKTFRIVVFLFFPGEKKRVKPTRKSGETRFCMPECLHFINLHHSQFSRRQTDHTFFLFFSEKKALLFHANCLIRKQFARNIKSYFIGKRLYIYIYIYIYIDIYIEREREKERERERERERCRLLKFLPSMQSLRVVLQKS